MAVESAGTGEFRYLPGFGDYWEHEAVVRRTIKFNPGLCYPQLTKVVRCCPPEDCDGTDSLKELLKCLETPSLMTGEQAYYRDLDLNRPSILSLQIGVQRFVMSRLAEFRPARCQMQPGTMTSPRAIRRAVRVSVAEYSSRLLPSLYRMRT